jgi:hypothetical protein
LSWLFCALQLFKRVYHVLAYLNDAHIFRQKIPMK